MSLFKKPSRKVRQRLAHSDSEEDEGHSCLLKTREERRKEKEKEERANSAKTLLSFGGGDEDAEGEVFKVKKSSYSRRIAKELEKERKERKKKDDTGSNGQEQVPDESSTKGQGQPGDLDGREERTSAPVGDIIVKEIPLTVEDIDIRVKNSDFKVLNSEELENVRAESKTKIEEFDDVGDGRAEASNGKQRGDPDGGIRFNRDRVSRVLERGAIPDAATIFALKKQRQQAAGRQGPEEFIPLKEHNRSEDGYGQNNNNSSSRRLRDGRLVNEDDDDSGGEEGRLNFSDIRSGIRDDMMRTALGEVREGSHDDSIHDETDRWEKEQIRKGVATLSNAQDFSRSPSPNPEDRDRVSALPPVQIPSDKTNLTVASIVDRVRNRLQTVQEIVARSHRQQNTIDTELDVCFETIQRLDREMPRLEKEFRFYQEMRTYSMDLIECFDSKMPIVNALEGRLLSALAQRSEKRMLRRRQDVKDQAEEVRPGAIIDSAAKKRAREREGRRVRRKTARQTAGNAKHNEGMSSDDEEAETDRRQLASHREQVLADGSHVFDDVHDDFSRLSAVLNQFEEWKCYFNESYREAYIPICVLKLVVPFVRIEMLAWNPLENPEAIEKCEWYKELLFYGQKIEDEDDSDVTLIPKVVERAVLPKLSQYAERVWDPMSASETRNLVRCIRKLADDYPISRKSKQLSTLLGKVYAKLQTALQEDVFIPMATKEVVDNPLSPVSLFFHRQFWSAVKLLQNILSWHGILAEKPLKELAIMGLLNRYLLFAFQCTLAHKESAERAEVVCSMLPTAWLRPEAPNKPAELQMWVQYLQNLLRQLRSDYAPDAKILAITRLHDTCSNVPYSDVVLKKK